MDTLITIADLDGYERREDLLFFDCRFSLQDAAAGQRAYLAAHIPAARFADMNQQLSAPQVSGVTGRHPLPARADWLRQVQAWGIDPALQVVAYDDVGGAGAARLWWLLKWVGHEKVAVLDGGWQAWLAAGHSVSTAVPAPARASQFDYAALPTLARELTAGQLDATQQCLLDARDPARFRGEVEPIDPVAGHIPGALCSPFSANLGLDGRFQPVAALQQKFAAAVHAGKPIVCYCGSGVTACHNILALTYAGLPMPALYAGSWSEWITDPARPVATGA